MLKFLHFPLTVLYLTIIIDQHETLPNPSYLDRQPRMISARPVNILRYPFLVRVVTKELIHAGDPTERRLIFSLAHGSLLTPAWVVTGSLYLNGSYGLDVIAGATEKLDITKRDPGVVQKRHVKRVYIHPEGKIVRGNHYWDVALLQLERPMVPSEWVHFIGFKAIPEFVSEEHIFQKYWNTSCTMAGMGMTCNGTKDIPSESLGEITTSLLTSEVCHNLKQIPGPHKTLICTYSPYSAGYRGDVGAPLLCGGDLIGIFQGGRYDCTTDRQSRINRFTRTDMAKPWIMRIIDYFSNHDV